MARWYPAFLPHPLALPVRYYQLVLLVPAFRSNQLVLLVLPVLPVPYFLLALPVPSIRLVLQDPALLHRLVRLPLPVRLLPAIPLALLVLALLPLLVLPGR